MLLQIVASTILEGLRLGFSHENKKFLMTSILVIFMMEQIENILRINQYMYEKIK